MKTQLRKGRVQTTIQGKSMTQQNYKQECDVNSILERYKKTGHISHVRKTPGQYGDFSQTGDYQSSMNRVLEAQDAFMSLPAVIRKRFGNDPQQLFEFINNEHNYEEAEKLGLLDSEAIAKRARASDVRARNGNSDEESGKNSPDTASQKPSIAEPTPSKA